MTAYSGQQELIPVVVNLGAAVAAGTNETWGIFTLPTDIPTAHVISCHLSNGANVTANATDFNVYTLQKGSTTIATLNCGATNLTEDTPVAFTRSTTIANRKLTGGDVLKLVKTATLNGTAGATTIQAVLSVFLRLGSEDLGES